MVAHAGAINALAQQLLKLTAPGVPDIYQGTELWDQSLVDPDNRRPVDYSAAHPSLAGVASPRPGRRLAADLLATKADGRIKLYLTSRALAFRAAYPRSLRAWRVHPAGGRGSAADHVVAFARRDAEHEVIVAVPRLVVGLVGKELVDPIGPEVWGDTRLLLPDAEPGTRYRDVFSGETIKVSAGDDEPSLPLAEVFAAFPFALLERTLIQVLIWFRDVGILGDAVRLPNPLRRSRDGLAARRAAVGPRSRAARCRAGAARSGRRTPCRRARAGCARPSCRTRS